MNHSSEHAKAGLAQRYRENLQLKKTMQQLWQAPQGEWAVLDGLRGFAMLLVILLHCIYGVLLVTDGQLRIDWVANSPWWVNKAIHARGADIIFFISAFLVTDHCLACCKKEGWHFYHFYWRRLLRIYPLFLVAIVIYLSLGQGSSDNLLSNLLMAVNFFDDEKYIVPVGWSIVVQVQFYLVLPLILGVLQRVNNPVAWILVLLLLANLTRWLVLGTEDKIDQVAFYRFYTGQSFDIEYGPLMYYSLHTRMEPFVLGILLAFITQLGEQNTVRKILKEQAVVRLAVFVAAILFMVLPCLPDLHSPNSIIYSGENLPYQYPYLVMHRLVFVFGFFLLTLLMLGRVDALKPVKKIFEFSLWRLFSQLIYPVYLFHMLAIVLAAALLFQGDREQLIALEYGKVFLLFLLSVPLSVLIALPFHLFIEKPLTRFGPKK